MSYATFVLKEQIGARKRDLEEVRRAITNLEKQLPPWRAKAARLESEIIELKADLKKIDPEELRNIA